MQDKKLILKELHDLREALDASSIVTITDAAGVITHVNDRFCEISKYERHQLLGKPHSIVNSGYHPREFFAELWKTITAGRRWHGEIRNRARDGSLFWVDTTIVPLLDEKGIPYRYVAIKSDATARIESEQRVRENERLLGEVLDSIPSRVALLDGDATVVRANRAWTERHSSSGVSFCPLSADIGANYLKECDADASAVTAGIGEGVRAVLKGEIDHFEREYKCGIEDQVHWFLLSAVSLRTRQHGAVVTQTEITPLKDVEAKARESEEIRRRLTREEQEKIGVLESITEAFVSLDRDFHYVYINPSAERNLGRTADELRGKRVWDVFPDILGTRFEREYRSAMKTRCETVFEEYYQPFDCWLEVRAFPWKDGLAVFYRDVTARKRADEIVRETTQLLEQTYDAIFHWNRNDGITFWNANAEKLYGFTATEAIGRAPRSLLRTEFPTSDESHAEALFDRGLWEGELIQTTSSGEQVIVESRQHVIRSVAAIPLVLETSRDVTDRRRLESSIARSSKLALVGELAAGLAHEIKNPLAGIKGVVDILIARREGTDGDELEILRSVSSEIDRIDRTVKMLLRNSSPKPIEVRHAALDDTIRRAVKLASYQFHNGEKGGEPIRLVLPKAHVLVPHDEASVEDAVLNLVLNAGDAIRAQPDGRMTVELKTDARAARIEVSDNGCGIDRSIHDEIFLPFKTSKNDGTGLGLTAVKRIARAHGGDCTVRSEPGKGSTFTMTLPLAGNAQYASDNDIMKTK